MWSDLQESFYLTLGPLIIGLILPLFGGAGIVIAILMSISWFWRPLDRVRIVSKNSNEDM